MPQTNIHFEEINMKRIQGAWTLVLSGLLLVGALATPLAAQAAEKSKVVIQVSESDPAKWNLVLNNAANLQKDVGKAGVAPRRL